MIAPWSTTTSKWPTISSETKICPMLKDRHHYNHMEHVQLNPKLTKSIQCIWRSSIIKFKTNIKKVNSDRSKSLALAGCSLDLLDQQVPKRVQLAEIMALDITQTILTKESSRLTFNSEWELPLLSDTQQIISISLAKDHFKEKFLDPTNSLVNKMKSSLKIVQDKPVWNNLVDVPRRRHHQCRCDSLKTIHRHRCFGQGQNLTEKLGHHQDLQVVLALKWRNLQAEELCTTS